MRVTFTKAPGRRYFMAIEREHGIELAPRQGPGYHDYLPHDAVHFIVEREAGLAGGVFGRIADGQSNIFSAADPRLHRRSARREAKRRPTGAETADMERSETLASICLPMWELRAGQRAAMPAWSARIDRGELRSPVIEIILPVLDEFARRWHALPVGAAIVLEWEPPAVSSRRPASPRARPARRRARAARSAGAAPARGRSPRRPACP
jgi:hypothetical protein